MPVLTNRDLFNNRQLRERGFIVDWDQPGVGTFEYAGSPLHFSDAPELTMRPSPALGEHNREILSELRFSAVEIAQFESSPCDRHRAAPQRRSDLTARSPHTDRTT